MRSDTVAEAFIEQLHDHVRAHFPDQCNEGPHPSVNPVVVALPNGSEVMRHFKSFVPRPSNPQSERDRRYVVSSSAPEPDPVVAELAQVVLETLTPDLKIPHTGWATASISLGEAQIPIEFAYEGIDVPARFRFTDGSEHATPLPASASSEHRRPLDSGPALLEPITAQELANIEPILQELWKALDRDTLSPAQRHQIVAMGKLIEVEQRAAELGETERWKLIGPIRAALKYLAKEAPRDALAWWKLAELLEKIEWSTLAGELPL